MKVRALVMIALLIPVVASAQRRGGGGRINPGQVRPASLPTTAPVVAKEMSYVHHPISSESYFFMSFVNAPAGANAAFVNFGSLGAATHIDYRLNKYFSATGDIMQSLMGGPSTMGSFEVGSRFRPVFADAKVRPFVDARLGYMYSYESFLYTSGPNAVIPYTEMRTRYGRGFGAIGGVGSDYQLTRTFALTTGFWATRSRLETRAALFGRPAAPGGTPFHVTTKRLALGLKWNPVIASP